ncbi:MAG: hypothetical protein A4E72_01059 [Syntrophus sp. PtaU1.Bin208]|nr:MAG: hypothetical protein A4E72_01059 [Syntrophus sp. PtaU1.Bin208]
MAGLDYPLISPLFLQEKRYRVKVLFISAIVDPSGCPGYIEETTATEARPEMKQSRNDHPRHGKADIRTGQLQDQHLKSTRTQQLHGIVDIGEKIVSLLSGKIGT